MKIIGVTVGTSLPKPNFDQTNPKKGDYIKGDRSFLNAIKTINGVAPDGNGNVNMPVDEELAHAGHAADAKAVGDAIEQISSLVGDTSVSAQITNAMTNISIDEIDEICGVVNPELGALQLSEVLLTDQTTGITYILYIDNEKLIMDSVGNIK